MSVVIGVIVVVVTFVVIVVVIVVSSSITGLLNISVPANIILNTLTIRIMYMPRPPVLFDFLDFVLITPYDSNVFLISL